MNSSTTHPPIDSDTYNYLKPFNEFLEDFKAVLNNVFNDQNNIDYLNTNRGFPPMMLETIMSGNPLSVGIPTEYGGRGGSLSENLAVLAAASYQSLALSLTLGINSALFLQPVSKYAQDDIKASVFNRFLNYKAMGGLMITEPDHGSDALNMNTSFVKVDGHYHLQGTKHWAGLTGFADFWVLTARQKNTDGKLLRDIDFFICDVSKPDQKIIVEEEFDNLGLYPIPYGRNHIDVRLPELNRLIPHTSGVKMMLDLLHRSRLHFPGMGLGFIKRMLDEAIAHCQTRNVGGKSLFNYDQVQQRLARHQSAFTICSALCAGGSDLSDANNDLTTHNIEANVIKSVTADLMQETSQSLLQLIGAKAYRLSNVAGRASVDSRPFQIFEGSNDILYTQISQAILKLMKQTKEFNVYQFFKNYTLTANAVDYFKGLLDFEVNIHIPQRKLVELGSVISRVIAMEYVIELGNKGFRTDMITNALMMLKQEVTSMVSTYSFSNTTQVITDYEENASWFGLA